jgi:phage terminase large subunit
MNGATKLHIEANAIHRPLWQSRKRYVIEMGGRGAGRSYETSQKITANLVQTKRPFRAAIMRAVHTDIRHSIWQELTDRVRDWEIDSALRVADSTMEMEYRRNSVHAHGFRRSSSDRTAKLKSLAGYTDAFIEEAEEIGEDEFRQLDDSLRAEGSQIHLSLNTPAKSHWIIQRWFNVIPSETPGFYNLELKPEAEADVEFIFSTHANNPYLANSVHERYESYRRTKPAYYWQMIRGLCPEVVMGRIYSGWREILAVPHEARFLGYGLDFGFDPDPAALLGVYYHDGGYILEEKLYANELTNDRLATSIKLLPAGPIVGDSAEPKSIAELSQLGIHVIPCGKGKDSINFGIKHVQALRISYVGTGSHLKYEYENYAWKRNKDAVEENDHLGIEDPKCPNHLMSAARYFLMEMVKADADPEADIRKAHRLAHAREQTVSTARHDAGL